MGRTVTFIITILAIAIEINGENALTSSSEVTVTSILHAPFLTPKSKTQNDTYKGFIPDLLEVLSEKTGLSHKILLSNDGKYGSEINGTWNGMVKMIIDNTSDMIAGDLTMSATRNQVLDFSVPFLSSHLTVLTAEPRRSTGHYWSPLSFASLALMVASYIISSILYKFIHNKSETDSNQFITFGESFWFVLASGFRGPSWTKPKTISRLLLHGGWSVYAKALFATYFACLAVNALDPPRVSRFHNVKQMIEEPGFKLSTVEGGTTFRLLKTSKFDLHQRIYERLITDGFFVNSYDEGVERVRQEPGRIGMVMESPAAIHFISQNCDFYNVGNLEERHYALAFKRGSPLVEAYSSAILRLSETGAMQNLIAKWWPGDYKCSRTQGWYKANFDRYSYELFFFLGITVIMSCVSLFVEQEAPLKTFLTTLF